jgi:membrane associated rhomboid family serine protease
MVAYVNLFFIVITCITTIMAFRDAGLLNKLLLYPRIMNRPTEYYRFLTSGFVHADYNHLIFNMLTLYFFGDSVRYVMEQVVGGYTFLIYSVLYLSAIVLSSLPAFFKHRDNAYYRSLGASGGVSAILFFTIYYFPWSKIYIMFIPIGVPAILYGILYTLYSYYMAKRGTDNIGHDAHLAGGLYGFLFALLIDPTHGMWFVQQIVNQ